LVAARTYVAWVSAAAVTVAARRIVLAVLRIIVAPLGFTAPTMRRAIGQGSVDQGRIGQSRCLKAGAMFHGPRHVSSAVDLKVLRASGALVEELQIQKPH
jgi:hypothetical protein